MTTEPAPRPDGRERLHPTDYGDAQWHLLVAYALARADTLECALPYRVVRQQHLDAPLWPPTLEAYRGDLLDRTPTHLRWGRPQERPVEIARFRLTPALSRFVRGARRLEDWAWAHNRPEDPTFLSGEVPILATESVQGRVTVFATDDERQDLASGGVRLVPPLGVEPEPWPTP